jgi:Tfp pilus assembly protein PilF
MKHNTIKLLLKRGALILSLPLLIACNPTDIKQTERQEDKQQAEALLKSVGLKVSSVDDALLKAQKAEQESKMDLAQLYYIKAFELAPTNIQVLQAMVDLYIKINQYELAEVSLKLMLKQQPTNINFIEQYGLLQLQQRKWAEAKKKLMVVVSKQASWQAYNGLGVLASLQHETLDAEQYFRKADQLAPHSPDILNNIGFSLYSSNQLVEAGLFYDKALAINPTFKKALYNSALLQAKLEHYDLAYRIFVGISSEAEANNNLGYILMMKGDYAAAYNYLQEAIRLSPQYYKKANDNLMRLKQLEGAYFD